MSLPVWEEWIEIPGVENEALLARLSLPVWEEWIEIGFLAAKTAASPSLPVWEEWIEICMVFLQTLIHLVSSRM